LIITTSRDEALNILEVFNQHDRYVKFELEQPSEGKLSLLDFTISINNDRISFSPYKKQARSDIFMSGNTALPTSMKRNVILNEWHRIKNRCETVQEMKIERKKFIDLLKMNNHINIPPHHILNRSYTHTTIKRKGQTMLLFKNSVR
jgi:hypothetical protein